MVQTASVHTPPLSWVLTLISVWHFYLLCLMFFWLYAVIFAPFSRSPTQIIYSVYFASSWRKYRSATHVMAPCSICAKRVQNRSFQMKCSFWQGKTHLKGLPMVNKDASIYVHRDTDIWFCTMCTRDISPSIKLRKTKSFYNFYLNSKKMSLWFHLIY